MKTCSPTYKSKNAWDIFENRPVVCLVGLLSLWRLISLKHHIYSSPMLMTQAGWYDPFATLLVDSNHTKASKNNFSIQIILVEVPPAIFRSTRAIYFHLQYHMIAVDDDYLIGFILGPPWTIQTPPPASQDTFPSHVTQSKGPEWTNVDVNGVFATGWLMLTYSLQCPCWCILHESCSDDTTYEVDNFCRIL